MGIIPINPPIRQTLSSLRRAGKKSGRVEMNKKKKPSPRLAAARNRPELKNPAASAAGSEDLLRDKRKQREIARALDSGR